MKITPLLAPLSLAALTLSAHAAPKPAIPVGRYTDFALSKDASSFSRENAAYAETGGMPPSVRGRGAGPAGDRPRHQDVGRGAAGALDRRRAPVLRHVHREECAELTGRVRVDAGSTSDAACTVVNTGPKGPVRLWPRSGGAFVRSGACLAGRSQPRGGR